VWLQANQPQPQDGFIWAETCRCDWELSSNTLFTDVCANGANFVPLFFQFQSVPANRFARSLGLLPPVPCIRISNFRAIIFVYPEDGGKNSSRVISIYHTARRQIFLKFMYRTISTFSRKSLLHGVGYSLSAEHAPVWRHSERRNWELRRGILRPVFEGLLQDVSRPISGLTLKGQWCNEDNTHCYNLQFGADRRLCTQKNKACYQHRQ
jgi:hypothetical protein